MSWNRTARAAGLLLTCLVFVVGGGCSSAPRTAETPTQTPAETADVRAQATPLPEGEQAPSDLPPLLSSQAPMAADVPTADQSAPVVPAPTDPADRALPAAAPAMSPVPSASPAAVASPSPAAAVKTTPTPATPVEVVAVSMADSNRIAEIDPVTGKVRRMVEFSQPAGTIAAMPDGHSAWMFEPHASGATIDPFDLVSGDRHEKIRFHESDRPVAAAFSADGARAYVATSGTVVYSTAAGKEFGRVTLGRQSAGVEVVRHISNLAISADSNGDTVLAAEQSNGLVWALDGNSGAVLDEINVGGGPIEILVDPASRQAYVVLDTMNQVVAIDTTTYAITNRLQLPGPPLGAALSSNGTLFITGGTGDTNGEVWVVPPGGAEIRARVPVEGRPVAIAVSVDGKLLYIGNATHNKLDVVSTDTVQVMREVRLPSPPVGVLVTHPATVTPDPKAAPRPAPSPIATATPLPTDALPPDHMPTGAIAEPFLTGAAGPVALAFAPDGKLFYNELKTGKIRVVKDGVLLPNAFYQFIVDGNADGGLVGLTLDPDFATNHYVYAMYTTPKTPGGDGSAAGRNQIVRLTDVEDKGTELKRIVQDLPTAHGEGALGFGADGMLYVSVADDDKGAHAQDLQSLAGKILRVNADGSTPTDNPFVGQAGKQEQVWAFGLRGAQSLAFQPVGHQLFAVVGSQSDRDALQLIVRGGDYGWPGGPDRPTSGVVTPLAVVKPSIQPTGSTFYTGDQLGDWKNDWFYCSAGQGQLHRVRLADQSFDRIAFEETVRGGCTSDVTTGTDGALYYSDGHGIYRIRMPGTDALPAVKLAAAQ